MHELAFGISGYNEAFFTAPPIGTRNPYDRRASRAGSSGTGPPSPRGWRPAGSAATPAAPSHFPAG